MDGCPKAATPEIPCGEIETLADGVVYRDVDQGKAAALRTGIRAAGRDIVLTQDADLEYHPAEYADLLSERCARATLLCRSGL